MRTQKYDCPRCRGMMVETYSELLSPSDKGEEALVWRCVNCGEYVDSTQSMGSAGSGSLPTSAAWKRIVATPFLVSLDSSPARRRITRQGIGDIDHQSWLSPAMMTKKEAHDSLMRLGCRPDFLTETGVAMRKRCGPQSRVLHPANPARHSPHGDLVQRTADRLSR